MPTCDRQRCKRTAEIAPKVVVPHEAGAAFDERRQISVLIGTKLCRRCSLQMNVAETVAQPAFIDFARKTAANQAKFRGVPYQEPDFARARVERIKLGSAEYLRFAAQLPSNQGGKP